MQPSLPPPVHVAVPLSRETALVRPFYAALLKATVRVICLVISVLGPAVTLFWVNGSYWDEIAEWHLKRRDAPIRVWVVAGLLHVLLAAVVACLLYLKRPALRIVAPVVVGILTLLLDAVVAVIWWVLLFLAYPHGMR